MSPRRIRKLAALAAFAVALAPLPARAAAQITIINNDGPNEGFNDPTAATPVGGNTGTTVGQQRLIAFDRAAEIWSQLLDSSVEIRVRATFDPLTCTADNGALGGARPAAIVSNSPNAPVPGAWYAVALANKMAGEDLTAGADDITVQFNSRVGETGCLENSSWYYGLDGNHGDGFDLVAVLLHELGHGLGFVTFVDESTGAEFGGQPDVFESMILDTEAGKHWPDMTPNERVSSAVNTGALVWDGAAVHAAVPRFLGPLVTLHVDSPAPIAGDLAFGTAVFGPDLGEISLTHEPVAAPVDDANPSGPTTTDGCTAYTNASAIAGRVALVDRGECTFVVKAQNAQSAGAVAIIVANNVAGDPPGMDGLAPDVTIPVMSVTQADGAELRASLGAGVVVSIGANPRRRAGVGSLNRPLLYAPNPDEPGSSISHWDTSASPNLLMEPNLSADLPHDVDLTLPLLRDIGWSSDEVPATVPREAPDGTPSDRETREVTVRP